MQLNPQPPAVAFPPAVQGADATILPIRLQPDFASVCRFAPAGEIFPETFHAKPAAGVHLSGLQPVFGFGFADFLQQPVQTLPDVLRHLAVCDRLPGFPAKAAGPGLVIIGQNKAQWLAAGSWSRIEPERVRT